MKLQTARPGLFTGAGVVLVTLVALTGCMRDKSAARRSALKDIGLSFAQYTSTNGCLPAGVGQTIESQVPSNLQNCPTCGKPWSYAKITAPPPGAGAATWDPVIAWCATCEADGGRRDALTYYGRTIAVPVTELRR